METVWEDILFKNEPVNISMENLIKGLHLVSQIQNFANKDYGRLMGTLADGYSKEYIEKNSKVKFLNESDINDISRNKNASGYDLLTMNTHKRVQVKFRQLNRNSSTYFTTTRRHSAKNEGVCSETGQIAYSSNEFDLLFLIIAQPEIKSMDLWEYSCIPVQRLIDENNPEFLKTTIDSYIINEGKSWKRYLEAICL